ncbi:TPA: DUF2523 domain-containing protein [Mannheimia haemolytica]|nr:DUF2523 domain-containing protein [Mannheimia haemolytica]
MFKVIFMALSAIVNYLISDFLIKGVIFLSVYFLTSELLPVVIEMLVSRKLIPDLNALFGQLPESMWYFFNIFQIPMAISLMISAMISRFVRRMPFIG